MTYNTIIFTDVPSAEWFGRGYGAYRLATQIRDNGYSALTVDYSSTLDWEKFKKIIDLAVSDDTLFVGFSTTWFPYGDNRFKNKRYLVGFKSQETNPAVDFHPDVHEWYGKSLSQEASVGNLYRYVDYIKSVNPKVKVIVGGAKANEYIHEPVDNVFVGYSEAMIIDYLNSISGRGPKRIFNKIIDYDVKGYNFDFRKSQTIYVDDDILLPEEVSTFEFSRGCIFNCAFCSFPHRGQKTWEYIKYKEVIREELLTNWEKYGIYRYVITDDTFNDSTGKLELINEVIQSLPFKPKFWAYVRLDLISRYPEQAQLLKDIGVVEAYYGLECWGDNTAKAIRKGGDRNKKIEGMKIAKECWGDDVYVISLIVVGLPRDTLKDLEDCAQWYEQEGHKYIDCLSYCGFAMRAPDDSAMHTFLSDIEKDPTKYGYSFPNPEEDPIGWQRNDDGDITNKAQADSLCIEYNKRLSKYWPPYGKNWRWTDVFSTYDPEWGGKSAAELVFTHTKNNYWPQLFKRLENRK